MAEANHRPLSPKQEEFCRQYLACGLNSTEAARRAGYKHPDVQGPRLLGNVRIKARIEELQAPHVRELDLSAAAVLREIGLIAFARMGNVLHVTEDGDPYLDFSKAGEAEMAALSSAEIEDFVDKRERDEEGRPVGRDVRRVKGKFNDKLRALELLGKTHRLFVDRVEVKVGTTFADQLSRAKKRADEVRKGRNDV